MEQLLAEGAELAVIGYHINDAYTNVYSEARAEYYNMLGLPHVMIDGEQSFDFSYDAILERYEDQIALSSHYSISIDAEREGSTIQAVINAGQISAPSPETKVLHVVLTESHIPETWYGGNELNHTERLMIPDQYGSPFLSVSPGIEFEFEMDTNWVMQHCELIAFIQDTVTLEVVQAQVFSLSSLIYNHDVSLKNIVYPGNSYCYDVLSPVIEIENYGIDTLFNCLVMYAVNGIESQYNWNGQLATGEVAEIILPGVSFVPENQNTIEVEVSMPNGVADENPDNNSMSRNFSQSQVISGQNLILELKTDNLGSETSWQLLNSQGEELYSGSGYENDSTYSINWIMETSDCYTFIIYDSAGDGLCCESGFGYYRIKDPNEQIYFIGGNFGAREIEMFELDIETGISEGFSTNDFSVYPNPVKNKCTITSEYMITKVEVINLVGQSVYTYPSINCYEFSLDFDGQPNGIYFIRINTYQEWRNYKILKNN
ncbi:MAG: T9SS type A sorting domain-containing protein [Bacteroidales bacterium]